LVAVADAETGDCEVEIHAAPETIHPIDPKYLPTGGFGYSETSTLLKESNAEEYEHPDFGKAWLIENAPELTAGETYTVVYNGTEYNCVCQPAPEGLSQDAEAVAMGNFSVAGGENTGEPFAMMISCMFNRVDVIDLSNASVVQVAITKEKINKIDKKYLSSGVLYADENRLLFHDSNFTNPVLYEEGKVAGNIIIHYEENDGGRVVDFYPVFKKIVAKVNAVEFQCIDYDDNANPGFKTFYVGVAAG
jgi:hypothetical protein